METPFFFPNSRNLPLFGIIHEANAGPPSAGPADTIIYCHPIFEEKQLSHRIGGNFARFPARRGFHILRFAYFGDGESAGDFDEASLSTRIVDILAAIEYVKREHSPNRVFLLGLRLGATLSLLSLARSPDVAGVIAWEPIVDTGRYLHNLLRANLSQQMVLHNRVIHDREALVAMMAAGETVNIDGYDLE